MSREILSSCDLFSQIPDVSPFEVYVTAMSALKPWGILHGHTVDCQSYPAFSTVQITWTSLQIRKFTRPAVNQTVVLSQVPAMKWPRGPLCFANTFNNDFCLEKFAFELFSRSGDDLSQRLQKTWNLDQSLNEMTKDLNESKWQFLTWISPRHWRGFRSLHRHLLQWDGLNLTWEVDPQSSPCSEWQIAVCSRFFM